MTGVIAVHCGAGEHKSKNHVKYNQLCKLACKKGVAVLNNGGSALDAVKAAIIVLEDNPLTNAGVGSNLTTLGTVELDASIMDGQTLTYGGCGCVTKVKNPIALAHDICIKQSLKLPLGLIPPNLIVGRGTQLHAKHSGLKIVNNKHFITRRTFKQYEKYSKILQEIYSNKQFNNGLNDQRDAIGTVVIDNNGLVSYQQNHTDNLNVDNMNSNGIDPLDSNQMDPLISYQIDPNGIKPLVANRMDTVGAVCIDNEGNIASGCSSGGLLLKRPGRIGQGALFASGVWADSFNSSSETSVAVSTTGCGEHLVQTQFAREIGLDLKTCSCPTLGLSRSMRTKFLESRFLRDVEGKMAGALVLHVSPSGVGEVLWGHSTQSMSVGYMKTTDVRGKAIMSEMPKNSVVGNAINVGGYNFDVKN